MMKFNLDSGGDGALPFYRWPYSTRFFDKYKACLSPRTVEIIAYWPCFTTYFVPTAGSRNRYSQQQALLQETFLEIEMITPCCCDESCEFVETTPNLFVACTSEGAFAAAICGNRGKLRSSAPIYQTVDIFMHLRQQILRTFFNSSPQDLVARRNVKSSLHP